MTIVLNFLPEFAKQLRRDDSGNQADHPISQLTPHFGLQPFAIDLGEI